jgi:hypothetical protein
MLSTSIPDAIFPGELDDPHRKVRIPAIVGTPEKRIF